MNFGLTGFSHLLKLLGCGIFASWTDTSYVGYISGIDMAGPIKKSFCLEEWGSPTCCGVRSVRNDGGGACSEQKDGQLGPCISDEQSHLNLHAGK